MSSNDLRTVARIGIQAVATYFGGPVAGAVAGMAAGMLLPNELPDQHQEGPRLSDLKMTGSTYGRPIPVVYKMMRLGGNIIWSTEVTETSHVVVTEQPGGKGGGGGDTTTTTYTYSVSFFLALCEGEMSGFSKLWANGKLIVDRSATAPIESQLNSASGIARVTFYSGSPTQPPDALMVATDGDAPGYRGICGILFEGMQLEAYGNRIPNLEAEVVQLATIGNNQIEIDNRATLIRQSATIADNGLLIAAIETHPEDAVLDAIALLDPFTGAILQKYLVTGFGTIGGKPVRNGNGDLVLITATGYVYWPANGSPVSVHTLLGGSSGDFMIYPLIDAESNFYGAMRLNAGIGYVLWRIKPGEVLDVIAWLPGYPSCGYYNYDGRITLVYAINTSSGPWYLAQYDTNGTLLRSIDVNTIPGATTSGNVQSICVAGDGSFHYISGESNRDVYRIDPNWTTKTKLTNNSSNGIMQNFQIARDWSTGDVLFPKIATIERYSAAGTFIKSYGGADGGGVHIATHPSYPNMIFTTDIFSNSLNGHLFYLSDNAVSPTAITLASVITNICVRCGLTAGDIDVTALGSDTCNGYVLSSQTTGRAALQNLMNAYFLDAVETNGKIKFIKRGTASVATIPEADLGEAQGGGGGDYDVMTRQAELELPQEISISFLDLDANYVQSVQFDRRLVSRATNKVSVQLPLALTASQAKQIASVSLYSAWVNRTRHQFVTSRKYSHIEPGDVVTLNIGSTSTTVRITDVRDQGTQLQFDAAEEESTVYTQTTAGGAVSEQPGTVAFNGPTNLQLLDIALIDSNDDYGIYAAGGGFVTGWPGGKVYKSDDGGTTYTDTGKAFTSTCTIGTCTTTLASYAGGNVFTEAQSLSIVLSSGSLTSITELAGLAGGNTALVGDEIITFLNATLVATNTYTLTTLLRGRLGTGWAMPRHRPNERFVLLDATTLRNLTMTSAEVGAARQFKGVTFGGNLAQSSSQPITFAGNRLKPIAPAQAGGGRNAAFDIILNWVRSARGVSEWRDLVDLALDETTESYEVDWFGGTTTAMTSISAALNGLVTTSAAHGRAVNDMIFITGVAGMTNINDRAQTIVEVPTTTTFKIGENTSGYTAGTGGVYRVRRAGGAVTASTPAYTYTAAQQTTDFGSAQSPAYYAIQQMSARVGRGYAAYGQI